MIGHRGIPRHPETRPLQGVLSAAFPIHALDPTSCDVKVCEEEKHGSWFAPSLEIEGVRHMEGTFVEK